MDQQDEAYRWDGVAAPQAIYTTFADSHDCTLSDECQHPDGYAINSKCVCKCGGKIASLHDPGCQGFQGALPDPPANGPPNGP